MGTNCVLRSRKSKKYHHFQNIDLNTTTVDYGFRLNGYCIQDNEEVIEHVNENYDKTRTYEQVKEIFIKLLRSQFGTAIGAKYLKQLVYDIEELQLFLQEKGRAKILGSSLFFTFARDYYEQAEIFDNKLHIVRVKLIDLCHVEHLEDLDDKDDGFLKGTFELLRLLNEIQCEFYLN
ncbi:UNKNOWN [Stylonychia lemnae]|uniref:Kinase n=1 Tax=Stylonychia lemnae TaxID=5949 RepID=A0A078B5J5_STYLE|nr:UNKNOWN [Stylonychia lemnae]|eukprot:CDW88793.1 UNKNOWN [Stylonychia lemnae]